MAYRVAHPRPAELAARPRRFDPVALWLDVVGAAVALFWSGYARQAYVEAERDIHVHRAMQAAGIPRAYLLQIRLRFEVARAARRVGRDEGK